MSEWIKLLDAYFVSSSDKGNHSGGFPLTQLNIMKLQTQLGNWRQELKPTLVHPNLKALEVVVKSILADSAAFSSARVYTSAEFKRLVCRSPIIREELFRRPLLDAARTAGGGGEGR